MVQVVARGQFAGERMALARQQVGHLRSLHFDREASKAAQAATQHETTLKVTTGALRGSVPCLTAPSSQKPLSPQALPNKGCP